MYARSRAWCWIRTNAALNILSAALDYLAAHRTAGQVGTGRSFGAAQRFWTEDR